MTREGLLRLGEVPLADLVREVTEAYVDDGSGPTFEVEVTHVSRADHTLTRQLLANLVGNAVKYSRPSERPHVTLRSLDDDEPGWVQMLVAARGVGIQPGDEQTHLPGVLAKRQGRRHLRRHGPGPGAVPLDRRAPRWADHGRGNEHGGATFRFTLPKA